MNSVAVSFIFWFTLSTCQPHAQGLSSLASRGGKRRYPGNEVVYLLHGANLSTKTRFQTFSKRCNFLGFWCIFCRLRVDGSLICKKKSCYLGGGVCGSRALKRMGGETSACLLCDA